MMGLAPSVEAKLFEVRARLLEAERKIYEANKILANVGPGSEIIIDDNGDGSDPVTGLYPGQYSPDSADYCVLEEDGSIECGT